MGTLYHKIILLRKVDSIMNQLDMFCTEEELRNGVQKKIKNMNLGNEDFSDIKLGELYAKIFQNVLRFEAKNNCWYYYNGKVWRRDYGKVHAKYYAIIFAEELIAYCANLPLDTAVEKKIMALTNTARRDTAIKEASCRCIIDPNTFDTNINLFNTQNGTIDLETFEFRKHKTDDFLTRCSNVVYDLNAKSTLWEKTINEILENDQEKIDYLQRVLGTCLTGDVKQEEFYILYGATSRNGKSTVMNTISYLLGNNKGYAANVNPSTLTKATRNPSTASGDIARLAGVRLATINESSYNTVLDAERIKTMTGRDFITARALYAKEMEYIPQFKLIFNTNYLPHISDDIIFESGRVRVIEFNRFFSESEQDVLLKDKLREPENLSGILNWLLDGLNKAKKNGMKPPQCVIDATNEYRKNNDLVSCFIAECLEKTGGNSRFKDVFLAYQKWAQEKGYDCDGKLKFKNALISRNMIAASGTVNHKSERGIVKGFTIRADCDIAEAS